MRARLIAATVMAVACGTSTSPSARGISFTSGNAQADTILSILPQPLVIRAAAHQVVRFQSVVDSGAARVFVEPVSGAPQFFAAETTDASGQASIVVALGTTEGLGRLVVSVPAFGYVDTASFIVLPGNAFRMQAMPNDTDAYIGGTVFLRTAVVDRFGNVRPDPVSFHVLSGHGGLNGLDLGVNGYGPIQVVGSADGFIDTTTVYGVPPGTMAASGDVTGIFTFNLDGSNLTTIAPGFAGTLKWAPSGLSLVFDQLVSGQYGGGDQLQSVLLNGQVTTLVNTGAMALACPQYSRDGLWIYYDENNATQPIWRVHSDGSGDSAVFMAAPEPVLFPSPSPDGTRLAYTVGGNAGNLKVLTLSTGAAVDLGVKGVADGWSPVGNTIAYVTLSNALAVINSDGTGGATIAPGPYGTQFDWSPDGRWIIARNLATSRLELIQVASQLVIPLSYTGTIGSPTWH